MNKKDFLNGVGDIDECFISEANTCDKESKNVRHGAFFKRSAALIAAIVLLVALSVTAVAAIVTFVVPQIPEEEVESLNVRPVDEVARQEESKRIIRESLERSRLLYGETDIAVSDEEVEVAYEELYQNSMQKHVIEASAGMIKPCHYDTVNHDVPSGATIEGTGYFYDGYLPVIYIAITDLDGRTNYTFSYDPTLAKYGAFVRLTQNNDGSYTLAFIAVEDALDMILEVSSETIRTVIPIKNELEKDDGTFDYSAFYNALTSNTHREYFSIIFTRAGIEF